MGIEVFKDHQTKVEERETQFYLRWNNFRSNHDLEMNPEIFTLTQVYCALRDRFALPICDPATYNFTKVEQVVEACLEIPVVK